MVGTGKKPPQAQAARQRQTKAKISYSGLWNLYLVVNNLSFSEVSSTWELGGGDQFEASLHAVWKMIHRNLVDESRRGKDLVSRITSATETMLHTFDGARLVEDGEDLMKRNRGGIGIKYPWQNVDIVTGTGTVMLCLTLSDKITAGYRVDVLVLGADGTTTPEQGEGENALKVKMIKKNFEDFKEKVYSLMSKSQKRRRKVKVKKEKEEKNWNCRLQTRKKKGGVEYKACTYAKRRGDGEMGKWGTHCESENKNCLLASARRNLPDTVDERSWKSIWTDLGTSAA
jgi:hypothetical protein